MRDFEHDPNDLFGDDEAQRPNEENPAEEPSDEASESAESGQNTEENSREFSYTPPPAQESPYSPQSDHGNKKRRGGTSTLLIAFCLVLFIFVGISIGAIFDIGNPADTSGQSTTGSSGETTSASGSGSGSFFHRVLFQ